MARRAGLSEVQVLGDLADERLECFIRRTLEDARAKGRDHITQTELAVRAVREVRPDMTASEALAAVEMVRQS
jgi:uncharacterized protein YeeX (DUF496 family)